MSSSLVRKIVIWLAILMLLGLIWYFIVSSNGSANEVAAPLRGPEPGIIQVIQASDVTLHPLTVNVTDDQIGVAVGEREYYAAIPAGIEVGLSLTELSIPDSFYTLNTEAESLMQGENAVNLAFSELEPGFVQTVALWSDNISARNAAGTGAPATPIEIMVNGHDVSGIIGSVEYQTNIEDGFGLLAHLNDTLGIDDTAGVYNYTVNTPGFWAGLGSIALSLLPIFIIVAVLLFFLRQAQGGGSQAMNFGRSRAKQFQSTAAVVTFKDVAGLAEAKEELAEIVDFLKFPDKFRAIGARIPKGVLLIGPPGTGKTLVSRAVAGEAGVPFFSISGSEFVEMFVGVGASRVRDMFTQAKKQSPCIIFIDEIDAVGRQRGAGMGGGHDEREQTLNQILVEMDGFESGTNVIILAATNRPDILDPALTRPGRFDRRVILDAPDRRGREEIIGVHAKGKPFSSDVNFETVARQTPGFSGADLANLVNEAALMTARGAKTEIGMQELTEAIDRVSIGPARKSRIMTKKDREITAYHEAGHALVAHFMPAGPNVGKISITARGQAGGFTRYQQEDATYHTLEEFEALIASAMGGRVAEEFKFGSFTTGSSSDIENATKMARGMVTRYGMSKKLGARTYGKREEAVFLGRDMSEQRDYSLESEAKIDEEINQILDAALANARKVMEDNSEVLEKVAKYLLDYETLEADEFTALLEGKLVHKPPAIESKPAAAPDGQQPEPGDDKLPGTNRPPKEALGLSS